MAAVIDDARPIGVFDSGFGGLTAVREMIKLMPGEDIVYFGDTARVPYGTRSRDTLMKYARQDASFLITQNVKLIVVACGTVSSIAYDMLVSELPVNTIGVVLPTASKAAKATKNGRIAVWGTSATIKSGSFVRALAANGINKVCQTACPLLVPLVENGYIEKTSQITRLAIREYLRPVKEFGADTLILGCTHFPLVSELIAEEWAGVQINSGAQVAAEAKRLIEAEENKTSADFTKYKNKAAEKQAKSGVLTICSSDEMEMFRQQAEIFLGGCSNLPVNVKFINEKINIENY